MQGSKRCCLPRKAFQPGRTGQLIDSWHTLSCKIGAWAGHDRDWTHSKFLWLQSSITLTASPAGVSAYHDNYLLPALARTCQATYTVQCRLLVSPVCGLSIGLALWLTALQFTLSRCCASNLLGWRCGSSSLNWPFLLPVLDLRYQFNLHIFAADVDGVSCSLKHSKRQIGFSTCASVPFQLLLTRWKPICNIWVHAFTLACFCIEKMQWWFERLYVSSVWASSAVPFYAFTSGISGMNTDWMLWNFHSLHVINVCVLVHIPIGL